jgi:type IV pilus assembly protein PilV
MFCRSQKGFTLTEVLASVFLLALGIIGAAGMHVQALRTAQQSAFRTAALSLASEMADMMRMTLSSPEAPALLKSYLQVDFQSAEHSAHPTGSCFSVSCTVEQLVEFNIEQWKAHIESSLPDGRAKICLGAQARKSSGEQNDWDCPLPSSHAGKENGTIVIKVGWRDKHSSNAAGQSSAAAAREFPPLLLLTVAPYAQ